MAKYILKESELREIIKEAVEEELTLNENFGDILKGLGKVIGTAMKGAAMVSVPGLMASQGTKAVTKFGKNPLGILPNFKGDKSSGGNQNLTGRKSKAERQRERAMAGRNISYEYGRPETVPGIGRRTRLADKSEITAPQTNNEIDWGTFGRHYHDEGDRAWNRKVNDTENALIRNGRGSERRMRILQRRYKRILVDWLKDRDREYKTYIQSIN